MADNNEPTQITNDLMVTMSYTLTVDNQIIDSSKENGPIRFVQGSGEIIPGLERQLSGLALGSEQKIIVSPDEGYGLFDEERLVDMPRDEFPESVPLDKGVQLKMKDQDGNPLQARISEVSDKFVKLDFNHVLAGKELQFDITVVELREATPEELDPEYES